MVPPIVAWTRLWLIQGSLFQSFSLAISVRTVFAVNGVPWHGIIVATLGAKASTMKEDSLAVPRPTLVASIYKWF